MSYSCPNMMHPSLNFTGVTAASLLPPELLLPTLALTHPSPDVPAACRLIATAFRSADPTLVRSWHNNIIFHHEADHDLATAAEDRLNEWFDGAQQIRSRLAVFLKSRLPLQKPQASSELGEVTDSGFTGFGPYARSLAPDAPHYDPFINQALIDHLYSKCGPFARHSTMQPDHIQAVLQSFWSSKPSAPTAATDDDSDDEPDLQFEHQIQHPTHIYWKLLPDAIQLAIYFIRAGDSALLAHALAHLHRVLPSIATTSAPLFHWTALLLDNRQDIRQTFESIFFDDPTKCITFPLFLATLCAFDLSVSCIDAVVQAYNLDPSDVTSWLDNDLIMDCLLDAMPEVASPERAIQFLAWLTQGGLSLDSQFPLASRSQSWPLFVRLFREYDQPILDQVEDINSRTYLGLVTARFAFSSRVSSGEGEERQEEVDEVIRFAFEKGLMDVDVKGQFYAAGLSTRNAEWQELVESTMTSESDWISVLHHAIHCTLISHSHSMTNNHPCFTRNRSMLTYLLNQLHTNHGLTPTAYFARHGHEWTWTHSQLLFDTETLPESPCDLIACASKVAQWIFSPPSGSVSVSLLDRVEVLSRMLDLTVRLDGAKAVKDRLVALARDELAVMVVACACQLGIGARSFPEQECVDVGCNPEAHLPMTCTLVLDAWTTVVGDDVPSPCSSHVPSHLQQATATLVRRAAGEAGSLADYSMADSPSDLVLRVARGDTNLGRAAAILVEFDLDFVAENMIWTTDTPLWLWHKFPAALVAARIARPTDLIDCLKHVRWLGDKRDLLAIARCVPAEWLPQHPDLPSMFQEALDEIVGRVGED